MSTRSITSIRRCVQFRCSVTIALPIDRLVMKAKALSARILEFAASVGPDELPLIQPPRSQPDADAVVDQDL